MNKALSLGVFAAVGFLSACSLSPHDESVVPSPEKAKESLSVGTGETSSGARNAQLEPPYSPWIQAIMKMQLKKHDAVLGLDCSKYDADGKKYCEDEKKRLEDEKNQLTWEKVLRKWNDFIKTFDCQSLASEYGQKYCAEQKKLIEKDPVDGTGTTRH